MTYTSSVGTLAIAGGAPALPAMPSPLLAVSDDGVAAVTAALRTAPLSTLYGGFEVAEFEHEFARRFDAADAVAVSSGTSALHLSLLAAGVEEGDEVIVTPFSFVASVSVVVEVGAVPVYADIDPITLVMEAAGVRARLGPRTRAVIPVHHLGYPADVAAIRTACEPSGVTVIEDCAQAHGARIADAPVGTLGDYGCFSFNVGKILRTGEGGMVLTRDEDDAEAVRELRVNGLRMGSGVARFGVNATMPQPIAALGRTELRRLDALLAARAERGDILRRACRDLPVWTPAPVGERRPVDYNIPFLVTDDLAPLRDAIVAALRAENIPASVPYDRPLYHVPYLRAVSSTVHCPIAEDICRRYFVIDPSPAYSPEEVKAMAEGMVKVLSQTDTIARIHRNRPNREWPDS